MQTIKLFKGKKVRAVWDKTNRKYWVSVIDICTVVCGCEYDTARNYWKQMKHRLLRKDSFLTRTMHQLKMTAKDGKLRLTDVMDFKKVMQLIQALPYKTAMAFKAWVGGIAARHCDLAGQLDVKGECAEAGVSELVCVRTRVMYDENTMQAS